MNHIKAIKDAYGDKYEELAQYISDEGWIYFSFGIIYGIKNVTRRQINGGMYLRPKVLANLENNNGWVKINPDGSNLPKADIDGDTVNVGYMQQDGTFRKASSQTHIGNARFAFKAGTITHWRKADPIPDPFF